jgi:hypothetical protein
MSEISQTIAYLHSTSGLHGTGLRTQNVLWSDAPVFASFSESGGILQPSAHYEAMFSEH